MSDVQHPAFIVASGIAVNGYAFAAGTALLTDGFDWPIACLAVAIASSTVALAVRVGSAAENFRRGYRAGADDFRASPSSGQGSVRSVR